MQEYLDNGLQLGWLIVPKTQEVEIYRRDRVVEYLESNLREFYRVKISCLNYW